MVQVLLFMFLCHIIDDFVLQPVKLSLLKQKCNYKNISKLYKYDYLMAMFIHCLSWSIMIHIPILCMGVDTTILFCSIIVNLIIHFIVDHLKCNTHKINLIIDQTIHFIQIIVTFLIFKYL